MRTIKPKNQWNGNPAEIWVSRDVVLFPENSGKCGPILRKFNPQVLVERKVPSVSSVKLPNIKRQRSCCPMIGPIALAGHFVFFSENNKDNI